MLRVHFKTHVVLTFLGTLFLSGSASAAFFPGEFATYSATLNGRSFVLQSRILSVNETAGTLSLRKTLTELNGSLIQEDIVDESMSEHENNENLFFSCLHLPHEYNAQYEWVTVPAGRFNTCHIQIRSGGGWFDGYYGDVVFGVIKATQTNSPTGDNFEFELKAHSSF